MDSTGFDPRLDLCPGSAVDGRMLYEKALEPLSLPLPRRQFLESLRAGQLSEAFLNLTLLEAAEANFAHDGPFSMLAFANALASPSGELGCEFLMDHGFELSPHQNTLLDYFLFSSLDLNSSRHQAPMAWLMGKGAQVKPERRLCWRALQTYYPELFSQNQAALERAELDELLPSELAEVRESPRL